MTGIDELLAKRAEIIDEISKAMDCDKAVNASIFNYLKTSHAAAN